MDPAATLRRLQADALSGALARAPLQTLEEYSSALCHSQAFTVFGTHEFQQVSETVRIHLLRAHIQALHKHITSLDAKNTKLSWLVVALTAAALLVGIPQIWFAYRADKKGEAEQKTIAAQQQPRAPLPANQSPRARRVPDQPTKKTP